MLDINGFIKRKGIKGHEELAKLLGTTKKAVDSWSCGDRTPTFEMVDRMYRLGMTTEEIFGFPYASSVKTPEQMMKEAEELGKRFWGKVGDF